MPGFVVTINRDLLKETPILLEEIKPVTIGDSVQTNGFWESTKSKDILNRLRRLRFRPNGQPRTDNEKDSPEWNQQLTEFLTDLESWSAADEKSDVDYFHEKAVTFRVLSDVLPAGLARDQIWRNNASFLSQEYLPRNRIEWFMHASHFLDRVNGLNSKERSDLTEILFSSRNNILRTYAYLNNIISN